MAENFNADALKSYLETLSSGGSLDEIAEAVEIPMPMGGSAQAQPPATETGIARAAVKKMAAGQSINSQEAMLIEAIILPDKRPAIDIINNDFTVNQKLWKHYSNNAAIRQNILSIIPAVGRIEVPDHQSLPYAGSGFVVADDLIMTNRHVAEIFSSGLGEQGLNFIPGQTAGIDFKRERGSDESQFARIVEVEMIHPFWDAALLRVEGLPASVTPLMLSMREPEDLFDEEVALIGYPAFDPRNNTEVQNRVFGGVYNVKRLLPGKLKHRRDIRSYGKAVSSVTHDATSLGGNSGGPVINVRTREVVALHFAGIYKNANFAVPTYELSRDNHVVGTGIEFGEDATSNIEEPNPWEAHWLSADPGDEAAARPGGDGGISVDGKVTSTNAHPTDAEASYAFNLPIVVSVRVGAPLAAAAAHPTTITDGGSSTTASATERMVEPSHDNDYANRPGYDENFLGIVAKMPSTTDLNSVSKLSDGSHVLDYHHFSLIMNKTRRLPLITAANVDTAPASLKPDPSKKYSRRALNGFTSKNDREKWFADPRIPAQDQLPDKFFNKDRKAFDKGHVVRRNAVVWGRTYEEVQFANGDTFHSTNCSPQVKGFNRSTEGGIWGQLENHIFKQAKSEKICVFAGPVLKSSDPFFNGVDNEGAVRMRIPQAYWKVAVAKSDGALQVYAFKLDQDLSDVDFEFQVTPKWKSEMIKLSDLEQELGVVTFDASLHSADQFETDNGEAVRSTAEA